MALRSLDLMIGDWVQVPSLIDNVEHYDAWCKVKQLRDCDLDVVGFKELKYSEIMSIPLTPEILEKNGFIGEGYQILTLDDGHWLEYYNHEHRLTRFWEGIDEWQNHSKVRDVVFRCHCHYVHELQHALKLCCIEKEIEL